MVGGEVGEQISSGNPTKRAILYQIWKKNKKNRVAAPKTDISPVPDIVPGSWLFVSVTRNSCRTSVYDVVLEF